ncbi:hypothetical protein OEA41_000255 [Lepraria neglecta]|uniref:Uncharacterized protein n=1 Tax=Lepraria neglecta TaxID=209136 RepID=A0AAE0DPM2_9LECA|nr:hypothetical protein OEA41_000255 [Lepraria neglecta]
MEGIGAFFEAIRAEPGSSHNMPLIGGMSRTPVYNDSSGTTAAPDTFTANIKKLQEEILTLRKDVRQWHDRAEQESRKRIRLENEVKKTRTALINLRREIIISRRDARKLELEAHRLELKMNMSNQEMQQLMAVASRLATIWTVKPATRLSTAAGEEIERRI